MNLYTQTGIFTGGYPLEERDAFIERRVKEYDLEHPGNTRTLRQKKKTARRLWRLRSKRQLERDRKVFAGVAG